MASAAFHPLDPRGARQRLVCAVLLGALAWFVLPDELSVAIRALAAWDAAALTLLGIAWWIILPADCDETRRRAESEDPGRRSVWVIVLGASAVSVFGAASVVHQAAADPHGALFVLVMSVATVGLSWLVTHTAFTLRYAHLYYRGGPADEGGLEFPGDDKPDDFDFAYFAFTIGMCFQVSDVAVTDRHIRRTALLHSLMSFAYNTVIIALVLNLVMGHLG